MILKKNPTIGLPGAYMLNDSEISKRQGDQKKHSFVEKKEILHKRENGFTMNTQKYLIDRALKQLTHQFHKRFFHISKCLASNAGQRLQLEITKKE